MATPSTMVAPFVFTAFHLTQKDLVFWYLTLACNAQTAVQHDHAGEINNYEKTPPPLLAVLVHSLRLQKIALKLPLAKQRRTADRSLLD